MTDTLLLAFAQASGQPSAFVQLVPILIIFGIFYLLLIAPMRKRQKALQQLVDGLEKGAKVITNGGLHGEVVAVQEGVVVLKVADNVRIKVSKSAVAGLQGQEERT